MIAAWLWMSPPVTFPNRAASEDVNTCTFTCAQSGIHVDTHAHAHALTNTHTHTHTHRHRHRHRHRHTHTERETHAKK